MFENVGEPVPVRSCGEHTPPASQSLFWNVDFERLDVERDAPHILTRILEYGGIDHVRWAIATYGLERIHAFSEPRVAPS
jgi:hypothetical protein